MLKNKCCLYDIISIRFFSITICNLLIELPSYYKLECINWLRLAVILGQRGKNGHKSNTLSIKTICLMDNRGVTNNRNRGLFLLSTTFPGATPPPLHGVLQSLSQQVEHQELEADQSLFSDV
jgi:hypothetical protein